MGACHFFGVASTTNQTQAPTRLFTAKFWANFLLTQVSHAPTKKGCVNFLRPQIFESIFASKQHCCKFLAKFLNKLFQDHQHHYYYHHDQEHDYHHDHDNHNHDHHNHDHTMTTTMTTTLTMTNMTITIMTMTMSTKPP